MSESPLLELRGLKTYFRMEEGIAKAVDDVSYSIYPGKTLSVVGESGCGKSVTAMSIMGLVPSPPAIKAGGEILFEGKDLLKLKEKELCALRGDAIAMIFQEPMTALNPVYTVGDQIAEAVRLHRGVGRKEGRERAIEMLDKVGIPNPQKRVDAYPHEMSGGMRQRAMIAMALSCDPKLLIADEPTTALDVTIQAQILDLMERLQDELGMAILFITHDLGVVAEVSHDVVVMYAGKVVEQASCQALFQTPLHPYTQGLFQSLPDLEKPTELLQPIPGVVPSPLDFPSGCRFRNRCGFAREICAQAVPEFVELGKGHHVACHGVSEGWAKE